MGPVAPPASPAVLCGSWAHDASNPETSTAACRTFGIYGVVANSVARRTQEMGVRMALGADAARVLRMVLGQGLRLVGVGAVIGLVGAVATSRLLTGVMVGVDAGDPVVYAVVAVGLAAVAAAASYFPARRATRIDPIEALRPE